MSDIYTIINTVTGSLYVGATRQTLSQRWGQHRSLLNKGRHKNRQLQVAWKKYTAKAFVFASIQHVDDSENIEEIEQQWFAYYKSSGVRIYNRSTSGNSQKGLKKPKNAIEKQAAKTRGQKRSQESIERMKIAKAGFTPETAIAAHTFEWDIVSPEGELLHIKNLTQFCREHNLDVSNMRKVALGKQPVYKGWTPPRDNPAPFEGEIRTIDRYHKIKAPDGTIYETTNLEAFCREHALSSSVMGSVCNGKLHHHRGWTCVTDGVTPKPKTIRTTRIWPLFIDPDGVVHEVENLYTFCKEHALDKAAMQRVANGKSQSHKGWRRLNEHIGQMPI